MNRKRLTIALVVCMLLSSILLAACAKEEPSGSQETKQAAEPNESASNGGDFEASKGEAPEAKDPLGKYEEPITVTQVLGFAPPQDANTPKSTTPETNGYVTKLKEMLNIDLKYLWTVPTDQFAQKFSLSVASGELPDVMAVSQSEFEKFREDGLLADLTDAYRQYASPALKAYVEKDGGTALKMFTDADGKILGLPNYLDPYSSLQLLWIRTDWLEALNLEVPQTIEELEKVAEAFVNDDPDRNGKKDTYGITMNKALITWGFDARGPFYSMGAYPKAWVKGSDGTLVPGETQPETRKALEKLQTWYKKGILDKEFAFKDIDKVVEDVVAGKVGISFGEWWYPEWPLNLNKDGDPKAEWQAYPLPSFEGKQGIPLIPKMNVTKILVANKDIKNPEALVKMANFYEEISSPKYADENKPENGYVYNWFEPRFYNPTAIADTYKRVNEALKSKDESGLDPGDKPIYDGAVQYLAGDASKWGHYMSRVAESGGWGLTERMKAQPVVYNEFAGVPTPTQVEKGASLEKLTDETFLKIIVGSAPIAEFDKYVESWGKLGGNDIRNEVNDWYAEQSKK